MNNYKGMAECEFRHSLLFKPKPAPVYRLKER